MKRSTVQIRSAIQGIDVSLWLIAAMFLPKGWRRRACVGMAVLAHLASWAEISAAAKKANVSFRDYLMDRPDVSRDRDGKPWPK